MRIQSCLVVILTWTLPFSVAFGQPCTPLKAKAVLFVTHPSALWDRQQVTKGPINEVAESFTNEGLPVIRLKRLADSPSLYFLSFLNVNVPSEGGDHQMCVEADEIYVSGGKFSMCSSETVRDILVNSNSKRRVIKINYLMNTIYEPLRIGIQEQGDPLAFDQLMRLMDDNQFVDYLDRYYFSETGLGRQNPSKKREATFENFTFEIIRNGRALTKLGTGPQRVILNFVSGK
ncbi:MAG: hypothetical protein COT74_03895 [Bdellovibrionales bacterium CG10_big_fil_rev_8_21_14_0_10_45_34]|nr:MAG: hypothetical protein COT74_03895 [Bdellovibrionales bacterium CG10_big_fil_rev_8_21_14_0_10_45_34]